MGHDSKYVCEGVVSEELLAREPNLVVPVAFILQTQGLDNPSYEKSQWSNRSIFCTKSIANTNKLNELSPINSSNINNVNMSKIKREIITAVIDGKKMIEIEKRNHLFISNGLSDTYL
jgi:hypothetical protein